MKKSIIVVLLAIAGCSSGSESAELRLNESPSSDVSVLDVSEDVNGDCGYLNDEECVEREECTLRISNRLDFENACWLPLESVGCILANRNCTNNLEYAEDAAGNCWLMRSGCLPSELELSSTCKKFGLVDDCTL